MEADPRYQWLEQRITASLYPKKEALLNLIENEDNKLVIMEFLNNEDVKQLYVYSKSTTQMVASRNCASDNAYDKGVYFLKTSNASKLTADQMNNQVSYFESSTRIFDHIDLMTREVFMPILCADSPSVDQADKLMDVMHRILSQVAVAQSQIEDSVTLPIPALSVLATAASNPGRRLAVLHILETTLIGWQRQIRNALKQQPEISAAKSTIFTKDEIQLWTSYINKLNNLLVQLDAPHVKDILVNLENNNSVYIQSFNTIRSDIKTSIQGAEINLRYISTLTPWIHRIKTSNLVENAQYLFTGLFHTLLLIWQHSKYYHARDKFAHMLLFLSNEIVSVSKEVVGNKILEDPLTSYNKLKESLRICAMFRGTYLDFKEKADALNNKFHKLDKKIDFDEKLIWRVQLFPDEEQLHTENDEYEVMRENSPWPKRNHNCFLHLNVFMERCNDVLELVQTMRHFQILSKTVSIGGTDNQNMDILAQEIHMKYTKALNSFQSNVVDVMNFDKKEQQFEMSFFRLRTTIKELERELSQILNLSIKQCTTIASKLRLLEVFEGVHERDVIQDKLSFEHKWLINEMIKEFTNVKQLCGQSACAPEMLPSIVTKLYWYHGLEQRMKVPMEKFSYLYPNLLQGDLGYQLRDNYKQTMEFVEKQRKDAMKAWQSKIKPSLTDKLQQTVLKNVSIDEILSKRPSAIDSNLDFELEKLLKEIHYMRMPPLNIDVTALLKDKFSNLKINENQLRLYATRVRLIVDKYNIIMKNIQQEEIPLFETKLNKIDEMIELGLNQYTWNSVEIPDYIEKAHSIICGDVYQKLELTQANSREICTIVDEWCEFDSDVFKLRNLDVSLAAKALEQKQIEYHKNFERIIAKGGNKIHQLTDEIFIAVEISEASPGWQEYLNYTNEIILGGFRISTLNSLRNMKNAMTSELHLKTPFVNIDLELVDNKIDFNPPLDENSHMKNLQEILFDFINTFISRGSYMQVLGKNRVGYDQMVARDMAIYDIVSSINDLIDVTCNECKKIIVHMNAFSFLWTTDIYVTFEEFLKGNLSISRDKQPRPPSKNFMTGKNQAKSITSLGSMLSPEVISRIERAFLSPYYNAMSKQDKEKSNTPLLEDFDSEIAIYVDAREQIKMLATFQDINWIRVNLEPTIQVLITITNKLIWKFTSFLSQQIKTTLNELDTFLKRMEPDLEKITGEERDTSTFMKIMRMFNEVSSKQQEMEIKFELMKKTLRLLKKYNCFDVVDLESKFNSTPTRWTNLKTKVNLAKQRLGPTIQEESKAITKDLKEFSQIILGLRDEIASSGLFDRTCDSDQALEMIDEFFARFSGLQNQAEDLKQLQELLESDVVDFDVLAQSKMTLNHLKLTWKAIKDIRRKHNEWKSIRWQNVNIKQTSEETDVQLEQVNGLPHETHIWDVVYGIKKEISDIKNCLPIIEEIANPAMRTRHWKQLVRISGGNTLIDNETLKTLIFGQLLELNLHSHLDEVKLIVQKSVKDLSIEQTIRTYEEIWLSKVFNLKLYVNNKLEYGTKQSEDDGQSSHDRRSSQSKAGLMLQAAGTGVKSNKRMSIGSLPQSLTGLEPINDNDPVYLFEDAESLFAELEYHQIVLEDLLRNQSAGSFYDEIIKWQNILQNIEAVLQEWNKVQIRWKRLEPIYGSYEIHTILPQDSTNFFKADKDFKILMKATQKNSNILKCCQRKNIISILKHLNHSLDTCYQALLQEMTKKRARCPRLYLLSDEDLLEVLTCGGNLERLSLTINRIFNEITSLRIETSVSVTPGGQCEKKIVGCFGKLNEYFPLKEAIVFKGGIEELVNALSKAIPESLRYLFQLAVKGQLPPYQLMTPTKKSPMEKQRESKTSNTKANDPKALYSINEHEATTQRNASTVLSWTLQHLTQIVQITLKANLTKQIETLLEASNYDELKKLRTKLDASITMFNKQLSYYEFSEQAAKAAAEPESPTSKGRSSPKKQSKQLAQSGILLNEQQYAKLSMIVKILIYYRDTIGQLVEKKATATSIEWLSKMRFYATPKDKPTDLTIKILDFSITYGFDYYSPSRDDEFMLVYQSAEIESVFGNFIKMLTDKTNPLLHGNNASEIVKAFSRSVGYENHMFLCSEATSTDAMNNICKVITQTGFWVTFLNLNNLTVKSMSALSNFLGQINERKETIIISNDQFKLSLDAKRAFAYFATTKSNNQVLVDAKNDSLKITRIFHYLNLISKDLLDKFRVVIAKSPDLKSFISSNLVANGFTTSEQLSSQILKLVEIYQRVLKVPMKWHENNRTYLGFSLLSDMIKEASIMMYQNDFLRNMAPSGDPNQQAIHEKNALALCFCNLIYPRIDSNNAEMLSAYLKFIWPDFTIPHRFKFNLSDDLRQLNMPLAVDKETAMHIEDKIILNDIADAVNVATQKLKLASSVVFQSKAVNLIEKIYSCKNLLMVGKSGCGKSSLLKTAVIALNELGNTSTFSNIYINSYTIQELFGHGDSKANSSKEGLIPFTLRDCGKNSKYNILHLVGESSPDYFYLYESLFSNDDHFLNHNNEITTNEPSHLKLVWETDDIGNLSPTLVANSSIFYLNYSVALWENIVESTFQQLNKDESAVYKGMKLEFEKNLRRVKAELDSKPDRYKDMLPVNFESKVRLSLSIMKSLLKNNNKWDETDVSSLVEYCVASGVSSNMTQASREVFNAWFKEAFINYPKEGTIYDYYYDLDAHQFQLWSENIPTFSCPIHQGIPLNIFVHTPTTMFLNSILDLMMNLDESVMIVGETGCGKTSLISDKLRTSCSGDLTEIFYLAINTNRLTTSAYLHNRINQHLSWLHGSYYVPKGNKRMYCFVDDLHQAYIDKFDRQPAIEILRQHLDSEQFFDFSTKKWQIVKNVTYISTFNHKLYSPSASVSNKILKHFHVVAQHFPSDSETHGIYTKLLYRHLIGDVENESSNAKQSATITSRMKNLQQVLKNVVQSSIDLNHKMRSIYLEKSQRLHYIFNLRVLTSLFRHMCLSLTPDCSKDQLLLLWHHECEWHYGYRMIDNVDVERYELAYKTVVKKNFSDLNELSILTKTVYFSNLKENESGIVISGLNTVNNYGPNSNITTDGYESTDDLDLIRNLIQTSLSEFNKEQQRISFPLYDSTLLLVTRLCHAIQCIGGNCCIVADGGMSPFILQLVACMMQYSLVQFKISQFMYTKDTFFQNLKHKLVSSYYKAGIRGEKVMICLTEEEMDQKEFLGYITEFLTSEEVMHLFTIEEETTILNSIRTQVVQAGLVYTKETAWDLFVKNIRENTRIVILLNENSKKFQNLGLEYQSLFNNMELIWIQHWNMKQLVENASYHFSDMNWMDASMKENLAHLAASMHYSIRENDNTDSAHLNNTTFTKFVEKFKEFLNKKYHEIEFSHKNICRLLEHIQKQHSIAKKLIFQLQQESMVFEERIKSTDKMLQQIGQDMTMTEQQLRVHRMQTKKTVQLKRILPEYQLAHERNVYKTVAVVANTKKLIQNINMESLQELRSVQKPDSKMEDILSGIIIILKSPSADVTWQKGAKRQMANLDRFLEELQSFDEHEINETVIRLLEELVKRIDGFEGQNDKMPYTEALNTLHEWIKGVIKYHTLMIKRVKPLHQKVEDIENEVKEAEQKLTSLNRKSEALNARLKDLAQNFEEATVDKKEQEEKVNKIKQQLQTASELNTILAREFERNMQIYESLQERLFSLPAGCALAAGFLVYLGPYQFPFRKTMLTMHWIKCLSDRGLPLVLDSLSLIKGRIIKCQMESLSHLLAHSSNITIPGDDWKVHFASEQFSEEPFILPTKNGINDDANQSKIAAENPKGESRTTSRNTPKMVKISEPDKGSRKSSSPLKNNADGAKDAVPSSVNLGESTIKLESNVASVMSNAISETDSGEYFVSSNTYRQFLNSLIQYIVGENECMEWMADDATGLDFENGAIISNSKRHPPLIYDPFAKGINWILLKITKSIIDLETKNPEDMQAIEKSFITGTPTLYSNCNEIDSLLLPMIYYKNAMLEPPGLEESRLILFSNRRLFCNPAFQMYFQTLSPLNTFTTNTLTYTTPITYNPSIENLIDQFQLSIFAAMFPEEYKRRKMLLNRIRDCNEAILKIDEMLKSKWEKAGFQDDEILLNKMALQRKYSIGDFLDYCQDYLKLINELMKVVTPLAIRASLLMTLSLKMSHLSKNYEFSIDMIESIFLDFLKLVKPVDQPLTLDYDPEKDSADSKGEESEEVKTIRTQLPQIPTTEGIMSKSIKTFTNENIETLIKHLTNKFLNNMMVSLLPEHRLYFLSLVCFYIKLQDKSDFSDIELEFLMRSKYNSNINVTLADFGVPKKATIPAWIPKDSWTDLLSLSLLQGDMDHFVVAVVNAEKDWREWYHNPFNTSMPKIEVESERSSKPELIELNEFRKLLVYKVLRPDSYPTVLNDYVNRSLGFSLEEPTWERVFQNPVFKSFIINMGSQSNMSNTSSMSRIHKNLVLTAKQKKQPLQILNCNFLNLSELRAEVKNITQGFLVLKNMHLASEDIINYIKTVCEDLNNEEKDLKWRLIITKTFESTLPLSVVCQSLQISFDVVDIMAHNSSEKNKKIAIGTCLTRSETLIFNYVQGALNLTKNDEIAQLIQKLPQPKQIYVFVACLVQGLFQSRQSLSCNGLTKSLDWGISCIAQFISAVKDFSSNDAKFLPSYLLKNVYENFLDDSFDKDYTLQLLTVLISSLQSRQIQINGVTLPCPDANTAPSDYPNWFESKIPERKLSVNVLQMHEKQVIYYNTIRAEEFIENLQVLWDNSSLNNALNLTDEIQADWLHFAIKMCQERLPGKLPVSNYENVFELKIENSVAFALYQECIIFNEKLALVKDHLQNLEKFLLLNTGLFPKEWRDIALTLQSQRVPDEWESTNCLPSIHSLKSWLTSLTTRHYLLNEYVKQNFSKIRSVKSSILRQPVSFLSAILYQKCAKNKWDVSNAQLAFEVREDDKFDTTKDGVILHDVKVIGAVWDSSKKVLKKSDNLFNKLPPLLVYAKLKPSKPTEENTTVLRTYITHLRQYHITDISLNCNCRDSVMPFLAFDTGDDDNLSRRQQKPIISNLMSSLQQAGSQNISNSLSSSPTLSAAGLSVRQSFSRLNQTLQQIREASAETHTEHMPSPESQLSYRKMTPNAPALPTNLQGTLTRSKPLSQKSREDEEE